MQRVSGVWKRVYGEASEAPSNERDGQQIGFIFETPRQSSTLQTIFCAFERFKTGALLAIVALDPSPFQLRFFSVFFLLPSDLLYSHFHGCNRF